MLTLYFPLVIHIFLKLAFDVPPVITLWIRRNLSFSKKYQPPCIHSLSLQKLKWQDRNIQSCRVDTGPMWRERRLAKKSMHVWSCLENRDGWVWKARRRPLRRKRFWRTVALEKWEKRWSIWSEKGGRLNNVRVGVSNRRFADSLLFLRSRGRSANVRGGVQHCQ